MRGTLELGERPAQAVFDGAIGLALATGVPLRLRGPLTDADLALAVAAVKLGGDGEPAREQLSAEGEIELTLPRPRAGVHLLELPHAGAVARALWTLSWPLALLGKPSFACADRTTARALPPSTICGSDGRRVRRASV